jgi:uncharacterized protein YabN with tetrapyrrole methylase and pyrophosphatase domain
MHYGFNKPRPLVAKENNYYFVLYKATTIVAAAHVEFLNNQESVIKALETDAIYNNTDYATQIKDFNSNVDSHSQQENSLHMNDKLNSPLHDFIVSDKDARDFGFEWPNTESILAQIHSECEEIKQAINSQESNERIQEEIGDLLHATAALCIFAGFDLEQTLGKMTQKFNNRMQIMKELTKQHGLPNLKGKSTKFMLELWDEAKNKLKFGTNQINQELSISEDKTI